MAGAIFAQETVSQIPSEETLFYNASRFGFSLSSSPLHGTDLSVEETILSILQHSEQPRLIEGIVVLLAKNKISYETLLQKAQELEKKTPGIMNGLGWILDEARDSFQRSGVQYTSTLDSTLETLYAQRRTNRQFFVGREKDESQKEYAEAFRGARPKKWNILYVADDSSLDKYLWTCGVVKSWTRR